MLFGLVSLQLRGVHKLNTSTDNLCTVPFFFPPPGWDQSDKFVKIYITLKDVQNIPADNVQVQFTER